KLGIASFRAPLTGARARERGEATSRMTQSTDIAQHHRASRRLWAHGPLRLGQQAGHLARHRSRQQYAGNRRSMEARAYDRRLGTSAGLDLSAGQRPDRSIEPVGQAALL